jgi:hypothetical protein
MSFVGVKEPYCMTVLKNQKFLFLNNFDKINLGLDLDPDWIRIQQQAESGPGSGKYLDPDSENALKL